jgi:hypothetical protein
VRPIRPAAVAPTLDGDDALLAFGVNIGNVGRIQPARRPTAEVAVVWSATSQWAGLGYRVVAWFRPAARLAGDRA